MARQFRYAFTYQGALRRNPQHTFALEHTLSIYDKNAAYTFIPKNGCSTMRYSIARANGCISNIEDINWIHANNSTFTMDTTSAATASYAFVILRCPFERLYSAFMDKIVGLTTNAWAYHESQGRKIRPYDITFDKFVESLSVTPPQRMDKHWRPQSDFLLYKKYDDIFCLEKFATIEKVLLERIDFQVIDTRSALNHDTSKLREERSCVKACKKTALELLMLKECGLRPNVSDFYDENLTPIVSKIYRDDIDLYCALFGKSRVMSGLGI